MEITIDEDTRMSHRLLVECKMNEEAEKILEYGEKGILLKDIPDQDLKSNLSKALVGTEIRVEAGQIVYRRSPVGKEWGKFIDLEGKVLLEETPEEIIKTVYKRDGSEIVYTVDKDVNYVENPDLLDDLAEALEENFVEDVFKIHGVSFTKIGGE